MLSCFLVYEFYFFSTGGPEIFLARNDFLATGGPKILFDQENNKSIHSF